ncbi:ATP-binding cassette domain-containing protein, partial [Streptomyces sp. NPDC060187]|uniref:ATP-binding cassette domain-containing protein n=1 Tax=Streptomyces sp. NPDC060187 TaxID=3347067 RepID=UPI0036479C30
MNASSSPPADAVDGQATAVELAGITKRFPGVVANHDIHLSVRKGTVHALVGENGAGKSTLMKIVAGVHRPDAGTIELDGSPVSFPTPLDAQRAGVATV